MAKNGNGNGNGKDWEAIEREYRAGQLSIKEIGRRYECSDTAIRKKAKKKGWKRSLSDRVRKAIREKMVRGEVREPGVSDEKAIDIASDRGVEALVLQREDIKALRELEAHLIKELDAKPTKLYLAQYKGKIIQKTVGLTVAERSAAANNLANVQHKRIQLERQALNLGDKTPEGEEITAIPVYFVSAPKVPEIKE